MGWGVADGGEVHAAGPTSSSGVIASTARCAGAAPSRGGVAKSAAGDDASTVTPRSGASTSSLARGGFTPDSTAASRESWKGDSAKQEDRSGGGSTSSGAVLPHGGQQEGSVASADHEHELRWDIRPRNLCDLCGCRGTDLRCRAGCDFDICRSCLRTVEVARVAAVPHSSRAPLAAPSLPRPLAVPKEAYRAKPPSMRPSSWLRRSARPVSSLLLGRRQNQQLTTNAAAMADLTIDLWRLPKPRVSVSARVVRKSQQEQSSMVALYEAKGVRQRIAMCWSGLRLMVSSLVDDLMKDEYEE